MKILIAAVAFIFMAAAADARHKAPDNPFLFTATKTSENVLEKDLHALDAEAEKYNNVGTAAGTRKGLFKRSKVKMGKHKPAPGETDIPEQDQNPAQNPANKENGPGNAQNPQEVKAIPKARRVEKPVKVEGSAKRPSVGSAKRGNAGSARPDAASAKPDRATNPNQVNRPARAGRPTGGGRPDQAGHPNKGKGKD